VPLAYNARNGGSSSCRVSAGRFEFYDFVIYSMFAQYSGAAFFPPAIR